MTETDLENRAVNTIRFLAADAVQKANSGHPGLPMGVAPIAYVLWTRHMRYDPGHPKWPNRDRFVLSAGHGSMLLYAMLHLTGYDLPLEELKRFRQWGSKTPGHPERDEAPGVETTTGPLGQGFANGVGMAVASAHLASMYNREGYPIVDHDIYAIVSDGDLMEGVASEAASLAAHLRLGRLIYLYDDNRISIDGSTDLAFTEDRAGRFEAYGWHVTRVSEVTDLEAVDRAIQEAKDDPRPSLVICRTHIGYGLPTKQDTAAAHGEPPGEEELEGAKWRLGWPLEPSFYIPDDVSDHFLAAGERGARMRQDWEAMLDHYRVDHLSLFEQWKRTQAGELLSDLEERLPSFVPDAKGLATRAASGKTLEALASAIPELIGGSADLTPSNKTDIKGEAPFSVDYPLGRYIHFGVREHAMGSILNGIASYGGLIPYGGTFLVFSDYMRPPIRLAAMMGLRVVFVFTHDSIGLGEDGPTHQPIEQLAALRAIPRLTVIRPADANETVIAWSVALQNASGPTALALTRQRVPTLDRSEFAAADGLRRGAYILADLGLDEPELILMASGSEVALAVEAGRQLAEEGVSVRLVSFPSWELFAAQPVGYRQSVLPEHLWARVAVEAAVPMGWERWVGGRGSVMGLDRFGASAPYQEIYRHVGLTVERLIETAREVMSGKPVR